MCWFCFQNDTFFETLLKLRCKLLFSGLDCSFGDLGLTSQRSLFSSDTLIFYKHHPFFGQTRTPVQYCDPHCNFAQFFYKNGSYKNYPIFYKNAIMKIAFSTFSSFSLCNVAYVHLFFYKNKVYKNNCSLLFLTSIFVTWQPKIL